MHYFYYTIAKRPDHYTVIAWTFGHSPGGATCLHGAPQGGSSHLSHPNPILIENHFAVSGILFLAINSQLMIVVESDNVHGLQIWS